MELYCYIYFLLVHIFNFIHAGHLFFYFGRLLCLLPLAPLRGCFFFVTVTG